MFVQNPGYVLIVQLCRVVFRILCCYRQIRLEASWTEILDSIYWWGRDL